MNEEKENAAHRMKCEEIQALLMDYFSHELGTARSELVREHLRKCENCRAAVAELSGTLELLRNAAAEEKEPRRLSEESRKRMLHTVMHPVLAWMTRHHVIVSIFFVLIVLTASAILLRQVRISSSLPESIEVEVLSRRPAGNNVESN